MCVFTTSLQQAVLSAAVNQTGQARGQEGEEEENDVGELSSISVERGGAPPEHAGLRPGEPVSAAGAAYLELLRFPV